MNIYTIKEVAQIFKLDYKLIEELLNEKKLGYIEIYNKIRITENQIKTFIDKKEREIDCLFINLESEEKRLSFEKSYRSNYGESDEDLFNF